VLLPLFLRDDEYHLVFTKRSLQLKRDGGVICFPGGTWESEDADLTFTALRETHEEIGVLPGDVQVLGGFEPVLTRSKFAIQPVVGVIPHPYLYQPSEAEVAEIIEIPLASLYDPANLRVEGVLRSEGLTHRFTYVYQGRIIFGATAQILTRLLELIAEGMEKEVPWQSRTPV
jgi:8-oxo-dGTP pyrophosphatase MutT (NUDIX family)